MVIQQFLQTRHLVEVFGARVGHHQVRDLVVTFQVFRLLSDPLGHKIIDTALHVTWRILLQTRHHQVLLVHDTSVIQTLLTVQDLHQGRFTCAVTAYQTDTFVIFDMQLCIIEKRCVAEGQPRAMHTN